MINKKISSIVFLWSIILFCLNLHYDFSDGLRQILFWISIFFIVGIIFYQIFFLKEQQFVLIEIIIFFFLLHLIYQIGFYGLRESDSYRDYYFLKTILNNNHIMTNLSGMDDISGWPLIHLWASFIITITKIDPLFIAKIFPSFISSIIAISIFLFISNLYKNKRAALLACLFFGTIPQFVSFEALFVRESYAFYFFILFFYILYVAKQRDDNYLLILSILLIPVIVLSHHFTPFMLIIFLLIFIVLSKIISFSNKKKILTYFFKKDINIQLNKMNLTIIFLILLICVIFYWFYVTPVIKDSFFKIYEEVSGEKEFINYGQRIGLGQTIVTQRGNIQFYGFFFFQGISALILLGAILFKKYTYITEEISFTAYLYFCLFFGSLSLLSIGSLIYPDRFLPFGWVFGVIPLVVLLFNLKKKYIKKLFAVIIIAFLIYNIYNINPNYYTGKADLGGDVATEKEYAIAETINVSSPYFGYHGASNVIFDIQGISFRFGGVLDPIKTDNLFTIPNCSKAIINKNMYQSFLINLKIKSPVQYNKTTTILSYENFNNINKISDLGEVFILTWKKPSL